MSAADSMRALLEPLGVYNWEDGSFQWAELVSLGGAVDSCRQELDNTEQEMNLQTAQNEGLRRIYELLAQKPAVTEIEPLRRALAALLRIRDGNLSLRDISDNISGCGVLAEVRETANVGEVEVWFPDTVGIPDDFRNMKRIIEDILPAHLDIRYDFWYVTWKRVENCFASWRALEEKNLSWKLLERYVR